MRTKASARRVAWKKSATAQRKREERENSASRDFRRLSSGVKMPFGMHRGKDLMTVPVDYLKWLLDGPIELKPGLKFIVSDIVRYRTR